MSKRKKQHEEEEMDESWLLPYADILTLLLALFIVLFAMSSVDAEKFAALSKSFNSVFVGDNGIMDQTSLETQQNREEIPSQKQTEGTAEEKERAEFAANEHRELEEVQKKINEYIVNNKLDARFVTLLTGEGLLITIRDDVLFGIGSAEMSEANKQTARDLSQLLYMDPQREILINGHTDNLPISSGKYESNWDLSVTRALNFMKIILENPKMDPKAFSAKGSGEYQTIESNDTAEGRAKNRRVEILVLPFKVEDQ